MTVPRVVWADWQAGPELDALIAEKVMGLTLTVRDGHEWGDVIGLDDSPYCDIRNCQRCGETETVGCDHIKSTSYLCRPTPVMYSQTIMAAWQVVEKMGGMWVCPADDGHGWTAGKLSLEDPSPLGGTYGDTAPLAICRAALRAHSSRDTP